MAAGGDGILDGMLAWPQRTTTRHAVHGAVGDYLRFEWAATMAEGSSVSEATTTVATLDGGFIYRVLGLKWDNTISDGGGASVTFQMVDPAILMARGFFIQNVSTNAFWVLGERGAHGGANLIYASITQGAVVLGGHTGSLTVSVKTDADLTSGKFTGVLERLPIPADLTLVNMGSYVVS